MTSYYRRYLRGDREAVWAELRALGPVPDALVEDAAAVADETMIRVAQHVARIAAALPELGWVPADPLVPPHEPPDDDALVDALTEKIGGLPLALDACLRRVGQVWFAGDCPVLDLTYHSEPAPRSLPPGPEFPDPLCLGNAYSLAYEWEQCEDPADFAFPIAPDELGKANLDGGDHSVALPSDLADPPLLGVAGKPGATLVEYLRDSVRWGGFAGWSLHPDLAPHALITLRADPDF
ncbi:hypothetical protein [Actinokineospora fastidiosa]|uniref:Uncharacterized protein n=1 Tax=Actinokineospora fastidiosa TaxID=1816 RepID=A0A918LHL2_9PSEU|nr:hypothetical protein [Actinokineospora fastidiosa]GGS52236.1 hypothetical protein GCM10010171_54140 [Actinokineospora fastidiosa]